MIQPGEQAPAFRAPSSQGQTLDSASFFGKLPVVLFFFPEAGTSSCDREIADFNQHLRDFGRSRVQVLGVSKDAPKQLRSYAEENEINVPLLADQGAEIIRGYGVEREDGRARRATVIVDRTGSVAHVFEKVDVAGHAEEVLATVARLKEEQPEAMSRPA